jgi:hypothetical protein
LATRRLNEHELPASRSDDARRRRRATFSEEVGLDAESIEAVARRVAELLEDDGRGEELIDAAEVARRFGVSRAYVYDHAGRLGAIPLSPGPKARLRFDPKRVAEVLAPRDGTPEGPAERPRRRRRRRRGRSKQGVELLPIRGERP